MRLQLGGDKNWRHAFLSRRDGKLYPIRAVDCHSLTEDGRGLRGTLTFPGGLGQELPFDGPYFPDQEFHPPRAAGTIVSVDRKTGQPVVFGPVLLIGTAQVGGLGAAAHVEVKVADKDYVSRELFVPLWHPQLNNGVDGAFIKNFEARLVKAREQNSNVIAWLTLYANWLELRDAHEVASWLRQEAEAIRNPAGPPE